MMRRLRTLQQLKSKWLPRETRRVDLNPPQSAQKCAKAKKAKLRKRETTYFAQIDRRLPIGYSLLSPRIAGPVNWPCTVPAVTASGGFFFLQHWLTSFHPDLGLEITTPIPLCIG